MEKPISLDELFTNKIFRIPDYQRGYAWQKAQLKDFWEDLINLSNNRSHYTGVLTLKEIKKKNIKDCQKEFWLIDDHSYNMYHVVDGQQRLTTFVIFIQAFVDFFKSLSKNSEKKDSEIFVKGSLNIESVIEKYLYKIKPTSNQFKTYKFGYSEDNPSYDFLRYKIFKEEHSGSIEDTFYTLNLKNAQKYFQKQIEELFNEEGEKGIESIYKKLTGKFLFNEYIIKDEFDVFVAFETMNNRGKKLSDLELLKNRLIYLTTLYDKNELDDAERKSLRDNINSSWKEVYYQLGRNTSKPLNDDSFLKAHWIMYFMYSRNRGNDYIKYLLDEEFSPKKVHKKVEKEVLLEIPEEQTDDFEYSESENDEFLEETELIKTAQLDPKEINEYVGSLKSSAVHWFDSWYPQRSTELDEEIKDSIERLNRVGIVYFRPLVMAVLKNGADNEKMLKLFKSIERFIFIEFRLNRTRSNYRSSEFYNYARSYDKGKKSLDDIFDRLEDLVKENVREDGTFNTSYLYNHLKKRFNSGKHHGYYGWHALRYLLYEYELSLLSESRQKKVNWDDLLKTNKDMISIEHIYPQTPDNDYWKDKFKDIDESELYRFQGTLGNLLLLASSINSSLQNDSFDDKKKPRYNDNDEKIRNGYSDGSHSEIEVANFDEWTPDAIRKRGWDLLSFMENRWNIRFRDEDKEKLLFLEPEE